MVADEVLATNRNRLGLEGFVADEIDAVRIRSQWHSLSASPLSDRTVGFFQHHVDRKLEQFLGLDLKSGQSEPGSIIREGHKEVDVARRDVEPVDRGAEYLHRLDPQLSGKFLKLGSLEPEGNRRAQLGYDKKSSQDMAVGSSSGCA